MRSAAMFMTCSISLAFAVAECTWAQSAAIGPSASNTASDTTNAGVEQPPQSDARPATAAGTAPVPRDIRDGRVRLGDMWISMPGSSQGVPGASVGNVRSVESGGLGSLGGSEHAEAISRGGIIVMPSNTAGSSEPLWVRREREGAQLAQIKADSDAAVARADALRAEATRAAGGRERPYRLLVHRGGYFGSFNSGVLDDGQPRGQVSTTVTQFDDLGSRAQRQFAEATRPKGLFEAQAARDAAVRQFNQATTPPIAQIQSDRDKAVINAQKDAFAAEERARERLAPAKP